MSVNVCLECFEMYDNHTFSDDPRTIHDDGEKMCPKVSCNGSVIELDELIAPTIIELNKKGYRTAFCCSGHFYENRITTYIAFADEAFMPDSEPDGAFEWDENSRLPVLRYTGAGDTDFRDIDMETKYHRIIHSNQILLYWAKSLDENQKYREFLESIFNEEDDDLPEDRWRIFVSHDDLENRMGNEFKTLGHEGYIFSDKDKAISHFAKVVMNYIAESDDFKQLTESVYKFYREDFGTNVLTYAKLFVGNDEYEMTDDEKVFFYNKIEGR
jgi:hypothetical protein